MNGFERVMAAVHGGPTDRVPVFPSMIAAAARLQGRRQGLYSTDGGCLAETLLRNREMFDFDGIYVSSDNWIMHSALGGRVRIPDDDEPIGTGPLCGELGDCRRLNTPDPARDGRMPVIISAAKQTMEAAGRQWFVLTNIDSGPFQLAGILRGIERFMLDIVDSPLAAHELIRFCAGVTVAYGRAVRELTGSPAVQFGDSTASLINRSQYEEFCFPYECDVINELHSCGLLVFLHICGDSRHILDLMVQTGADCLEIDEAVDLAHALTLSGNEVGIRGNLRTMLFLDGTPAEVEREARRCVELGTGRRYILSAGCGIPKLALPDNLHALRAAVERRMFSEGGGSW